MTMPSPMAAPQTTMAPSPTIAPTRPEPALDEGDHERMTHSSLKGFRPKDEKGGEGEYVAAGTNVVEGMVTGTPVRALCGKTWVPRPRSEAVPDLPDVQGGRGGDGLEGSRR